MLVSQWAMLAHFNCKSTDGGSLHSTVVGDTRSHESTQQRATTTLWSPDYAWRQAAIGENSFVYNDRMTSEQDTRTRRDWDETRDEAIAYVTDARHGWKQGENVMPYITFSNAAKTRSPASSYGETAHDVHRRQTYPAPSQSWLSPSSHSRRPSTPSTWPASSWIKHHVSSSSQYSHRGMRIEGLARANYEENQAPSGSTWHRMHRSDNSGTERFTKEPHGNFSSRPSLPGQSAFEMRTHHLLDTGPHAYRRHHGYNEWSQCKNSEVVKTARVNHSISHHLPAGGKSTWSGQHDYGALNRSHGSTMDDASPSPDHMTPLSFDSTTARDGGYDSKRRQQSSPSTTSSDDLPQATEETVEETSRKRLKSSKPLQFICTANMLDILCSATLELGPLQDNPTGCSCPRSNCIKLYCDCFKAGRRCSGSCSCINCKNTKEESGVDGERTKAIKNTLARNPRAFTGIKKEMPRHPGAIVCNCVKTKCLKLYCDCFRSGTTCNESCFCVSCLNTKEESRMGGKRKLAIQHALEKRSDAFTKKEKEVGAGCARCFSAA